LILAQDERWRHVLGMQVECIYDPQGLYGAWQTGA